MFLIVISLVCFTNGMAAASSSVCPCEDKSLCKPLVDQKFNNEVYFYVSGASEIYYKDFDWNRISTISVGEVDERLMPLLCYAHSKKVKVNIWFNFEKDLLKNDTSINKLVAEKMNIVKKYYLDGINIDFEHFLPKGDPARKALIKFVSKMSASLRKFNSKLELSFAHIYLAQGSVLAYDVLEINRYIDYFVIMDYDFSKKSRGHCSSGDNAGLPMIKQGVESFAKLGINPNKLILALPWFGVQLQCNIINKTTGRCSGDCKYEKEVCYNKIYDKLRDQSIDGRRYDYKTSSPFMIYTDAKMNTYRVDYDDYWSLKLKNRYAKQIRTRGIGVFQGNCMPSGNREEAVHERKMLWNTLPITKAKKDAFLFDKNIL